MKAWVENLIEKFRLRLLQHLIFVYWWSENLLETLPSKKTGTRSHIFFEPFSATAFFISLAVSAASFGAQLLIQTLLRPKPKPQVQGKLTGEITATDSIWGAPIIRIYGGRPEDDNFGGVEIGANIIWMTDIRVIQTTTQTGGGGGKGGPRTTATTTLHYKCDLAAAAGAGRLRLLRLKFNEDTVYNLTGGTTVTANAVRYEAEAPENTLGGGAIIEEDLDCSNDEKVTGIGLGGTLAIPFSSDGTELDELTPDPGNPLAYFEFTVFYKAAGDLQCYCKLDGTGGIYSFPASGGTVRTKSFLRLAEAGEHELVFSNPSAEAPEIDCVEIGVIFLEGAGGSGLRDDDFPAETEQDNILLPDPKDFDTNPIERFNLQQAPDEDGVLEFTLANGATAAWYEGTETQPIDAVIAANVDGLYGAGSTPAFLGTAYLRVQNLDISKYGAIPQIRFLVENVDTQTVEEICLAEAALAGLDAEDVDFSAGDGLHIRGMHGTGQDAPEVFFEMCATIHNLNFVETSDGKVTAKDASDRTIVATITQDDLGAFVADDEPEPPLNDFLSTVEDPVELIRSFELQFKNPKLPSDYDTDRVPAHYPYTPSTRTETKSLNATLLPEEAEAISNRLLQKHHLKQTSPSAFTVPHKYCWVDAGDCVSVEVAPDEFQTLRIEEKTGSAPGVYDMAASSEDIFVLADETVEGATGGVKPIPRIALVPANTVGTIIDIPALVDAHERKIGVYAAACRKPGYGSWSGAGLYRDKAGETALMVSFEKECAMGVALTALDPLPPGESAGFLDETSSVAVDFYGDFEPTSVDTLVAEEGANSYVFGGEICVVVDWTRDNDYPNRWTGTNIYRTLKRTAGKAASHVAGERVVYLNEAVKFISLDAIEQDVERTWRFVTSGQQIADAAEIVFTWGGENIFSRQVATLSGSAEVPLAAKLVKADAALGAIDISLPDAAQHIEREITIKKIDGSANSVTVSCFEAQTIDGAGSVIISRQFDSYTFVSDGANWFIT